MKASELIHNGLYLIHDANDTIVRYDIVSNSFRSEWYEYPLALFHEDVCATEGDRYMFVKPIPITEEILKKNELDPILYCDLSMPFWFMSLRNGNNHVEMPFEYVHQIQQALRLCKLNELADTFKV